MATTTSFKQQCPSCEAMVPIRDPGLIGRKIDCPKCKYRFVVEKPADAEVEPDITSLLRNDTQVVASMPMDRLRTSTLKSAALDERGGGFKEEKFRQNFGFGLEGIKRIVMTLNLTDKWVFTVMRTKDVVKPEQLKGTLKLAPAEKVKSKTGKSYDYFLIRG